MGSNKSRKREDKRGPIAPALEPLAAQAERLGAPVLSIQAFLERPAAECFAEFVRKPLPDIDSRAIGNSKHLEELYNNRLVTEHAVDSVGKTIVDLHGTINQRANDAGVNLKSASFMIDSALLLHLRGTNWNALVAQSLTRVALECAGRAALIANGTADEPHRWDKAQRFFAKDCIDALQPLLAAQNAAVDASKVYASLCDFTHMNSTAVRRYVNAPPNVHEDSYGAMAFTAWAMAVVAERVVGFPGLAKWPSVMPSQFPCS